jgi:hypothetical protein
MVGNLHLSVTALVDELANRLEIGVAVSNIWLNNLEHLNCGLGQANEDAIVDLEQTEKLERLALLGVNLVDTLDAYDKGHLWLGWDVERTVNLGSSLETDIFALSMTVLLDVRLGTLEDDFTLLLVRLFASQHKLQA